MKRLFAFLLALCFTPAVFANEHAHQCADLWPNATHDDIFYHGSPNGCGPDSILSLIIPDKIYFGKVNFTEACNNHDRCFMHPRMDYKTCADNFWADLHNACLRDLPSVVQAPLRELCVAYAEEKSAIVRTMGQKYFDQAKREQGKFEQCLADYGYHPRDKSNLQCLNGLCRRRPPGEQDGHQIATRAEAIAKLKSAPDDFFLWEISNKLALGEKPSDIHEEVFYRRSPYNADKVRAKVSELKYQRWATAHPAEANSQIAWMQGRENELAKLPIPQLTKMAEASPEDVSVAMVLKNKIFIEESQAKMKEARIQRQREALEKSIEPLLGALNGREAGARLPQTSFCRTQNCSDGWQKRLAGRD